MKINLKISCSFDTVFLLNGILSEGGEITYGDDEVVYITVLPLDALLLPYTVKLVGAKVKSNTELARCYRLRGEKYYLKLAARYNYVYSVPAADAVRPTDIAERFFLFVLSKNTDAARQSISRELSDSIDDKSLLSFFDGFVDIILDEKTRYYLIDKQGNGFLHDFVIKNGVIDNIIEL